MGTDEEVVALGPRDEGAAERPDPLAHAAQAAALRSGWACAGSGLVTMMSRPRGVRSAATDTGAPGACRIAFVSASCTTR